MSLSKYYKDSSSFKREDIVKSSSPDLTGWKSKAPPPPTPFEPGSISTEKEPFNPTGDNQIKPERTADPTPATASTTEAPPAANEQPANDPTAAPSIDLSNYISLEEAEEKAIELYQQGIQEGMTKAAEDFGSASKTLLSICEQLDIVRETIISNSSNELIDFAVLIAEKIIRTSLKEQDQSITATIQEALSRAVKSDEFSIFLHPDDYQVISDKSANIIAGVSGLSNIVIKTDPTIEKGGAKIESENCIIDATVASQFETIRDEINKTKNLTPLTDNS